jgi:hypothetical protein
MTLTDRWSKSFTEPRRNLHARLAPSFFTANHKRISYL